MLSGRHDQVFEDYQGFVAKYGDLRYAWRLTYLRRCSNLAAV